MQSPIINSLFSITGYNLHSISLLPVVPCLAVHAPGEERPVICFYQQLSQLECEMSNQIAERTIKSIRHRHANGRLEVYSTACKF